MITSLFSFLESSSSVQRVEHKVDNLNGGCLHKVDWETPHSATYSPALGPPLVSLPFCVSLPCLGLALSPGTCFHFSLSICHEVMPPDAMIFVF